MNSVLPWRTVIHRPYFWGLVAIAVLLAINVVKDPGYLAISISSETGNLVGNVIDILRASVPVLMVSIGMALVIATAGIDLSVGSIMAVSGATSMQFLAGAPTSDSVGTMMAAIGISLAISLVLGAINGVLVSYVKLQPIISTLVMMLAARGLAKVITGGRNTAASSAPFQWMVNGYVLGFPVVFLIGIVIAILVAIVVRRSALGLMIEATGVNATASLMAGIRPRGLLMTVYVIAGVMAGIAGLFAVGTVMTVDVTQTGYLMELDAILAVVIGGTSLVGGKFSLGGAVVGSLLIATLDKTVLFLGVSSSATPAFKAIVIIIVCMLQSRRIRARLGRKRRPTASIPAPTAEEVAA